MHQNVYILRKEDLLHLNHFQKWKLDENKPDFLASRPRSRVDKQSDLLELTMEAAQGLGTMRVHRSVRQRQQEVEEPGVKNQDGGEEGKRNGARRTRMESVDCKPVEAKRTIHYRKRINIRGLEYFRGPADENTAVIFVGLRCGRK
jgi:hypothetical protein